MASIPLPALHIQPPADPTESIGRMVMLKQALQQQQLFPGQLQAQQESLTAARLANQENQIKLNDQQAMTKAMQEWDGKDINALPNLVVKHGASAQAVMGLKNSIIDQQTKLSTLTKDQLANEKAKNDYFVQQLDNVKSLPPDQQPAAFQAAVQDAVSKGHLDPQQAQGMQYQSPQQLDLLSKSLMGHDAVVSSALKQAEMAKNTAQAGEAEAQTRKINTELQTMAGPLAEADYRKTLSDLLNNRPVSPDALARARAYEAAQAKTTTQSDSITPQGIVSTNTSKPSGLATVGARQPSGGPIVPRGTLPSSGAPASAPVGKPANLRDSLVDEIGQYKLNPQMLSRLTYKHPEILAMVAQKYPDWSQSNYNAINKAVVDLAPSGKTGQQITSYNTFLRHAGALYDAVNTLDNSTSSDLLNKPLNWLAQHTGDPRVADFMAAMQPPMKEFQSFLLNNHAMHEEDVKDAHALIDQNKTPQEIRAVLKRFAETGSARLSEQNESFKRVTGRDIPNLVSPEAAKAYNKITAGGGGSGGSLQVGQKVTLRNGKTVTIKAVHPDGTFDAD